jgi:hypothetical protein
MHHNQRHDLDRYLRRSPCARAVLSICRQVSRTGCGGLTIPALCFLLRSRHPGSTVAHASVALVRLRALVWTGAVVRTRQAGHAKIWRATP